MENFSFLRNRYWVLRHGKSIPNERGLIVCSMENGMLNEYQLASEGVNQAQIAGEAFKKRDQLTCCLLQLGAETACMPSSSAVSHLQELKENNIPLENVRICYSPFSRTTHTAKVVASVLNLPFEGPRCKIVEELRERYFGPSFELNSHDKYAEIWALDEKDPFMRPDCGESVADVVYRLTTAIITMEAEFEGCAILVVSHGDPLQILQTVLHATNKNAGSTGTDLLSRIEAIKVPSILSQHRKYALLTGELRQII